MIHPMLNLTVAGAAWYQGEANAGEPTKYACMFPAMISDWRLKFNLPLPFFFVQLAAYPDGGGQYAAIRWAQMAALANLPRVGMASAIDLGDPTSPQGSIHPRNKQAVGRRLALAAFNVIYHQPVPWMGPLGAAVQATALGNGQFVLTQSFYFVSSPTLVYGDTEACDKCCANGPDPFEVQSSNNTWVAGKSTIQGPLVTVAVTLPAGQTPIAVRYAWTDYPQCVLYDPKIGLPAPNFVMNL